MEKNNNFLIDTHIFILWMENSNLLSKDRYQLLNNSQNEIFISIASIWEIIIKKPKNKITVPMNIEEGILSSGFSPLPIKLSHILALEQLPIYHNDPFDRILITQAKTENLTFVTDDAKIKKYDLKIV